MSDEVGMDAVDRFRRWEDIAGTSLARAPKAAQYLQEVAQRPLKRGHGYSHAAAYCRKLGLIDDEVRIGKRKRVTAAEAKALLGPSWYHSAQFTGRERITGEGRAELSKLKPKA